MRDLHFDYSMRIEFENPVREHNFSLRCIPTTDDYQTIKNINYKIVPSVQMNRSYEDGSFVSDSIDGLGNKLVYGTVNGMHNVFEVKVHGDVTTGHCNGIKVKDSYESAMFNTPSKYTNPGPFIREYFNQNRPEGKMKNLDIAMHYVKCLNKDFIYEPGVTNVKTTAEEAMTLGRGVCQDYAHILISLCHLHKIPARYVAGMLIGEGASHAWVDVEDGGLWYQLDPTNNKAVVDEHIRFSHGRDYEDCVISKGIFKGTGNQNQYVSVVVRDEQ